MDNPDNTHIISIIYNSSLREGYTKNEQVFLSSPGTHERIKYIIRSFDYEDKELVFSSPFNLRNHMMASVLSMSPTYLSLQRIDVISLWATLVLMWIMI